jgi:chromosome segregation ATPase
MTHDTIRTDLVELRDVVTAGFARMDRYFELQQAQYLELRGEVRELTARVDRIEARLDRLQNEVRAFRDWVAAELAEVRHELRLLRRAAEQDEGVRRSVEALEARVTLIEERRDDPRASS